MSTLIADIKLDSSHPAERRAWFDPSSNPGSTLLMHLQPENIWRVDYQLRTEAQDADELRPERVKQRIDAHLAMLGERLDYELVWISLYKARALTLDSYRHGRVLFAGDAAHLVPIFGVRGLNSGIDDTSNLTWKLAAVLENRGPASLLDTYSTERVEAARENIRQATKSTLFMSPPTRGHELMREAALSLAVSNAFARPLVNPRQTTAIHYENSPLSTPDADTWAGGAPPGTPLPQAPVAWRRKGRQADGHLLDAIEQKPVIFVFDDHEVRAHLQRSAAGCTVVCIAGNDRGHEADIVDTKGRAATLLDLRPGSAVLVRPDGYVAARWRALTVPAVCQAVEACFGRRH